MSSKIHLILLLLNLIVIASQCIKMYKGTLCKAIGAHFQYIHDRKVALIFIALICTLVIRKLLKLSQIYGFCTCMVVLKNLKAHINNL